MLGQERRVHLGLGIKTQMNTPFLGHVGAMLGFCWYVPVGLTSIFFLAFILLTWGLKKLDMIP
jgi:hypothetical protein